MARAATTVALPTTWTWYDVSEEAARQRGMAPGRYASRAVDQHRSGWCGACYMMCIIHMIADRWNIALGRELGTGGGPMRPFVELDAQRMLDEFDCAMALMLPDWNACRGGHPMRVLHCLMAEGDCNIHVADPEGFAWRGHPRARPARCDTSGETSADARVVDAYPIPNTREAVKQEIYEHGTVALGIDAECLLACDADGVADTSRVDRRRNHAVSVIGWQHAPDGRECWVVRNSWGPHVPENMPKDMSCSQPGGNTCALPWMTWHSIPTMPGFCLVPISYVESESRDARTSSESPWYGCHLALGADARRSG